MKPRTRILLALGIVTLFALTFVLISASPRRRIPPGSIVLLEKSPTNPVSWFVVSNATKKGVSVTFGYARPLPGHKPPFIYDYAAAQVDSAIIQPHGVARLAVSNAPVAPYYPTVSAGEQLTGVERALAVYRYWSRWSKKGGIAVLWQNLFNTSGKYFGHYANVAPELLNAATNRIAKRLN